MWKKSKDQTVKADKPAVPSPSSAASAVPKLTEAERMKQTPLERVVYDMAHNDKVVNDLILGRRVSFYELRGEIGQGNFSTVKLGIHALTKGKGNSPHHLFYYFCLETPNFYTLILAFFFCSKNSSLI